MVIVSIGFGLSSLIIIPNSCITTTYKNAVDILSNQLIIDNYTINLFGKTWVLRGDDTKKIVEIRDRTLNLKTSYRPYSRIDGLKYPIQNIIASIESRNQIIVRRGADVVFSPESSNDKGINATMLTDPEVKNIQDAYSKYGMLKGYWHAAIFKIPTKVQRIERSPKELGLLDGEDQDIRAILRAYNVPATVFGLKDENKYNTYLEGKAEFYEDGVIPHAGIISEGFDSIFESQKYGYKFLIDFSHLQCMQRSEKDKAAALQAQVNALNSAMETGLLTIDEAKDNLKDYLR